MERLNPYLDEGSEKQREVRNKTSNFVWEWRMVQPTHLEQWYKHGGSRNGVKARKKQSLDGVEHT